MTLNEIEKMADTALQNGRYDVSAALYLGLYETMKIQVQNVLSFPRYLSNPKEWENYKQNLVSDLKEIFGEKIDVEKVLNDVWYSIVNPPLELDELWEMRGNPIWIYSIPDGIGKWKILNMFHIANSWGIEREVVLFNKSFKQLDLRKDNYLIDWIAYRYPLKGLEENK